MSTRYAQLGRSVAVFVHGLYHLAHHYLEENEFAQIKIPKHKTFLEEYERFNQENGFSQGENLISFDYISKFMGHLTDTDIIPEISVWNPYSPIDKKII